MKPFPILYTDRCTLTSVSQEDIPVLRQVLDDTVTQRFLPELCEAFQTNESLQQFISSFDKYLRKDKGILWGIRKDNVLIGFVAIMDIPFGPTLFYAMHPHYRKQGYAKEAVSEVVRYFRVRYPSLHLHTEVYQDNQASISILLSCEFSKQEFKRKRDMVGFG